MGQKAKYEEQMTTSWIWGKSVKYTISGIPNRIAKKEWDREASPFQALSIMQGICFWIDKNSFPKKTKKKKKNEQDGSILILRKSKNYAMLTTTHHDIPQNERI